MIRDADNTAIEKPAGTFGTNRLLRALPRPETVAAVAAFILKRLALGALVLIAITYLSIFGLDMAKGAQLWPTLADAGADTVTYAGRLVRADLGQTVAGSITSRAVPVSDVLRDRVPKSFGLLGVSLAFATIVGIILGFWAAGRRHSRWSLIPILVSITGVSAPSFFAALLLQLLVIKMTKTVGRTVLPVGGFGWDSHLILPMLVLAARPVAQIARVTSVTIGDVLDRDYVRVARSKGLRSRTVMRRHVVRNAAIPILTTIGLSLRFSLSSLPVVEYFFGWPGLGFTLLKSISLQDHNLTIALLLCLGAVFVIVNMLLEASYRLIDPRLRTTNDRVKRQEQRSITEIVGSFGAYVRALLTHNPIGRLLRRDSTDDSTDTFRDVLNDRTDSGETMLHTRRRKRWQAWLKGTFGNVPFILGTILVAGIIAVVLFGPHLAPHSPYTTQGLSYEDGNFAIPPFAPSEVYPWGTDVLGRDIMSLILAGAQQTMRLVTLVVVARLALGVALGALAGWLEGSWIDRLLLGVAETVAAFPTLLMAMILILAFGIRQGFTPFVIGLSLVGWVEVMQYVRSEVMSIRPKPFVESAVAVGLRSPRIVQNHILPNLVPALISLAALEMGAVLMLLGELGFLGIFIGGGAFAQLEIVGPAYHYSDVPEWGSLLSNIRKYAQPYPWTALYPAMAFFVAILGFNLFGEGLRRLVEDVGVQVMRLLNRKTLLVTAVLVLAIGWVRGQTGALTFYQRQAAEFEGQQAHRHVEVLADPALVGRALGTPGMDAAADYVAEEFQSLGLQAAGEELSYFQTRSREFETLDSVPEFAIDDGGPAPVYREDYAEFPWQYRNLGEIRGQVRFVAFGELTREGAGFGRQRYPALEDLDFSDEILLVPSIEDLQYLQTVPHGGVLVVTDDPADLRRRYTLSGRNPRTSLFGIGREVGQDTPIFWISEALADRLLAGTGYSLDDYRRVAERLERDTIASVEAGVTTSMTVEGTVHEKVPARHVIGHLPGTAGQGGGNKMDDQMIVVLAQYDSPPMGPTGTVYPAANDNASGVAVMLEAIRTMQESGYQPYRTFLFVAYSGEGEEGGRPIMPVEVSRFLQAKRGFANAFTVEAVVDLRGLGTGTGDRLMLSSGGSLRLAELFEEAAGRMGVEVARRREPVDMGVIFDEAGRDTGGAGQEAPRIGLSWEDWERTSHLPSDTVESVSPETLERSGRTLGLALMILGRETQY